MPAVGNTATAILFLRMVLLSRPFVAKVPPNQRTHRHLFSSLAVLGIVWGSFAAADVLRAIACALGVNQNQ